MWVPIALSRDVPSGATRAVILDGRELALWRGEGGSLQVWEDRCPHRGMRLSFGFVRGDSLNCLYHGWAYGTGASCRRIPAHPGLEVPATIQANAFPVVEAGGMIWTAAQSGTRLPALPDASPLVSLAVDAAAVAVPVAGLPPIVGAQVAIQEIDRTMFYIGWHRVDDRKTMLHCATIGPATRAALGAVRALRDRAERLAA